VIYSNQLGFAGQKKKKKQQPTRVVGEWGNI